MNAENDYEMSFNVKVDWIKTGERIRYIIKQRGCSQESVAEEGKLNFSTFKHYLYGNRKIPIEVLIFISKKFGVEMETLLIIHDNVIK